MNLTLARDILTTYGYELYVTKAPARPGLSELSKRVQAVHPHTHRRIDLMSYDSFTRMGSKSFTAIAAREIGVQG